MSRKTKRLIFYLAILAFVIISLVVVLFALGYKYDFVQNKFFKTGSLELKSNIHADIYINDGLAGDTSFLSDSFSKGRMLPRTYSIRLESEGYQSWKKLVKIEAGFVASYPRVVLLPEDFKEEIVASSSLSGINMARFDSEKKMLVVANKQKTEIINLKTGEKVIGARSSIELKTTNSDTSTAPDQIKKLKFNDHEIWVEWLKDSSYQPFKRAGQTELITRFSQKLDGVQWYKDSEHLIVSAGGVLKFIEIDDRDGINIFDITTISGPFYYDKDSDQI